MNKWEQERQKAAAREQALAAALAVEASHHTFDGGAPLVHFSGITGPRVTIARAAIYLHGVNGAFNREGYSRRERPKHTARLIIESADGAKVYGQHITARLDLVRECADPNVPSTWRADHGYNPVRLAHESGDHWRGAVPGSVALSTVCKVAEILAERYITAADLRAGYLSQCELETAAASARHIQAQKEADALGEEWSALQKHTSATRDGGSVLAVLDPDARLVLTHHDPDKAEQERAHVSVSRYEIEDGKRPVVVELFPATR